MVDYYSLLLRTVTAPGAGDAQWRGGVYDRARQLLASELRKRRPGAAQAEIAAELAAMDAAIERIESEMAWSEGGAEARAGATADAAASAPDRAPLTRRLRLSGTAWIVLAVVIAALGVGGYVLWAGHKPSAAKVKTEAAKVAPAPAVRATMKDGDLPPGIDGGSSDADLPYVFRRQPTFYRTLQPVGTVIVDKLQHFLYLIQPNNTALRYGIGIGDDCQNLAGLRHIASKAEWPPWQAPPGMRRLASADVLPGGPGNPLGARLLTLDDGSSRINGTNAPNTIGSSVAFGCIRLVNDDIVDLYNRVKVSTPVVVN